MMITGGKSRIHKSVELPLQSRVKWKQGWNMDGSIDGEEDGVTTKRFKRVRSRHVQKQRETSKLREMIFLRDLHFGFLPDDCETEFADCFEHIRNDATFATKCFKLALLSRNEDLVRVLLDQLDITKDNFQKINSTFLEGLLLEAVELDDFESVQCILAWRDARGTQTGLTDVDKKLLKMQKKAQEVIVAAAVKGNYNIIKMLYGDGYKIFDRVGQDKDPFIYDTPGGMTQTDVMESHIERIRSFKAMASPAYMAMTYQKDPVEHCFDFTLKADLGMRKEPEFRSEYDLVRTKCRQFGVDILDSCRNSSEVEQVLAGSRFNGNKAYSILYRALHEDQKEFVSHPYCQVLLHNKWLGGHDSDWTVKHGLLKALHIVVLIMFSPILCLLYILSPYRDHSQIQYPHNAPMRFLLWFIKLLDRPIHRYILDMTSYGLFLVFILLSVIHGIGDHKKRERTWYFNFSALWILAQFAKDMSILGQVLLGRIIMTKFRFFYALTMDILFLSAIGYKWYGYDSLKGITGGLLLDRTKVLPVNHPINIGANLYGVACCMAFLKVIFLFEIHHRFGPILFCIKNVFWDILSIVGSFLVTVFAFAVGLVSVFGIFNDDQTNFSDFTSATKTLFWIIFDPGKEEYADIEPTKVQGPPISGGLLKPLPIPGFNDHLFATLRPPSEDGDSLSHNFGIFIWGFYQVFVVLIMMNLLISLMTTTFAKIQRNADVEWKFTRASIWIHYYDDLNSIPAPLNIIPSVYSVRKVYLWICHRGRFMDDVKTWASSKLMAQESKRRLYDTLIERVFRSEEKKEDSRIGRSDIEALEKEISIDIADLRRDIRTLRRDLSLPTSKFLTPRDGYPTRKISSALTPRAKEKKVSEEEEEPMESQDQFKRFSGIHDFASIKVDNRPEVVEHLVQTLGLIGVSTDDIVNKTNASTLERHNSIV